MEQYLFLKTIMVSGVKMIRILYHGKESGEVGEEENSARGGATRRNAEQLSPIN